MFVKDKTKRKYIVIIDVLHIFAHVLFMHVGAT